MPIHEIVHPFCKTKFEDGSHIWSIGCQQDHGPYGEVLFYAHGEGKKVMSEVARYTPPGYGEKVFFTVEYFDPDGDQIGRKKLQMLGVQAFERRINGFSLDYDLEE